ncbi:hypothetical protein PGUG_04158 [Meyerozyma guilliermondii ATCC 6260]|uniref:BOD1/SHG1 domain-containing protein n=1 Tax=Meyerozyma guilliermondii (strain ATCC 6260 / CBS 566 / DSM 6381 / JCM 1539 / NBRC 10279 / NRRL Y-324) TaxID=294746 RepID=A5DLK7_PICGU|nr:uncharacterized protein PGUG_04158 [Meyerozyma guilliermondii ATCC 6260]EDK40060.2 hypothetical protein PGUG_04158 [Meyerozyma guilliermondii ATCC 6260]
MAENEPPTDAKSLMSIYKRSGAFDQQRKRLLEDFKSSETHKNLLLKLQMMLDNKVKNDPSILAKNRGKMGALIQGEIVNQHSSTNDPGLLGIVDKDIQEKIIESPDFRHLIESEIKDIRRKVLGISDEDHKKMLEEEENQKLKDQEEAKRKASERAQEERDREERDRDIAYKNNFKVKKPANKSFKAPRIKFAARDGGREDDKEPRPLMY